MLDIKNDFQYTITVNGDNSHWLKTMQALCNAISYQNPEMPLSTTDCFYIGTLMHSMLPKDSTTLNTDTTTTQAGQ